jgi:hypothetical protein
MLFLIVLPHGMRKGGFDIARRVQVEEAPDPAQLVASDVDFLHSHLLISLLPTIPVSSSVLSSLLDYCHVF